MHAQVLITGAGIFITGYLMLLAMSARVVAIIHNREKYFYFGRNPLKLVLNCLLGNMYHCFPVLLILMVQEEIYGARGVVDPSTFFGNALLLGIWSQILLALGDATLFVLLSEYEFSLRVTFKELFRQMKNYPWAGSMFLGMLGGVVFAASFALFFVPGALLFEFFIRNETCSLMVFVTRARGQLVPTPSLLRPGRRVSQRPTQIILDDAAQIAGLRRKT